MNKNELNKLQQELKEIHEAIEIITNKLINIDNIENNFLGYIKKLELLKFACAESLFNISKAEKRIEDKIKNINCYSFNFRFKWMKRFFIK